MISRNRLHFTFLTLAMVLTVAEATGQNLITNGSFDSDVNGWSGSSGSLTVRHRADIGSTLSGGSGPGCMEVSTTYLGGGNSGPVQTVNIAAGAHYEFALTYYLPGADNSADYVSASVVFEGTDGTYISSEWIHADPSARDQWTRVSMSFTAPGNAAIADISPRVKTLEGGSGDPPARVLFDDVWLAQEGAGVSYQELFVPAAAAAHGGNDTYWSTTGWFSSLVDTEVTLSAALLEPGRDNLDRVAGPVVVGTVPPHGFLEVPDLVETLGGDETGAGLFILATAQGGAVATDMVRVTTHTFTPNPLGSGVYGQGIPALGYGTSGDKTTAGVFQGVRFRTNIGVLSTTHFAISVNVTITDANCNVVYDGSWSLDAFEQRQRSLPSLGISSLAGGTVTFSTSNTYWKYHGYISTVDQNSGDAVYNLAR